MNFRPVVKTFPNMSAQNNIPPDLYPFSFNTQWNFLFVDTFPNQFESPLTDVHRFGRIVCPHWLSFASKDSEE